MHYHFFFNYYHLFLAGWLPCLGECSSPMTCWAYLRVGLGINHAKSFITFCPITPIPFLGSLGFSFVSLFYLGVPLEVASKKKDCFRFITENVQSRLGGWQASLLSQAGKLTLIKSVISLPCLFTCVQPSTFPSLYVAG